MLETVSFIGLAGMESLGDYITHEVSGNMCVCMYVCVCACIRETEICVCCINCICVYVNALVCRDWHPVCSGLIESLQSGALFQGHDFLCTE